jgi:His/Glu/Gln/Arg/opine family amino acid ABC transporter permease subunit
MTGQVVTTVEERERPERGLRHFLAEQTPVSAATGIVGAASLGLLLLGTFVLVTAHGWIPHERIVAALTSRTQEILLWVSLILALAAVAAGWATYKRMDTKPSREAAVAGAVLGIQTVFLGGVFLWFLSGNVERFARNFFQFELVVDVWPRFVRGAVNTVILAFGGEALGIVLGLILAVFALSSRPVVRAPARAYINFLRGTPLLWQLTFFYFGIILGLRLPLSTYQAAILVLGLNAGAYSAEIFRAGVGSIERAQMEAARSLGMPYLKALRYVILPQAIRRVIPPLTNEFVILIKDTSLVAVLGLTANQQELLSVGGDLARTHFNPTPYLATAAGYLIVALPMIRVVNWLERKLRSGLTGIGA